MSSSRSVGERGPLSAQVPSLGWVGLGGGTGGAGKVAVKRGMGVSGLPGGWSRVSAMGGMCQGGEGWVAPSPFATI